MARESLALGDLLNRLRGRMGISAMELSRRAGLGVNYIRSIERGLRVPRADTLTKIADALKLAPTERQRLIHVAALSADQAGSAYPQVFRFLAGHLYAIEHSIAPPDFEGTLLSILRPASALLACVELMRAEPAAAMARRIKRAAHDAAERADRSGDTATPKSLAVGAAIITAWRSHVFDSPDRTARAVGRLASWRFQWPDGMAFLFSETEDQGWNVPEPKPAWAIADLHEIIIAYKLGRIVDALSLMPLAPVETNAWWQVCLDAYVVGMDALAGHKPVPRPLASLAARLWEDPGVLEQSGLPKQIDPNTLRAA